MSFQARPIFGNSLVLRASARGRRCFGTGVQSAANTAANTTTSTASGVDWKAAGGYAVMGAAITTIGYNVIKPFSHIEHVESDMKDVKQRLTNLETKFTDLDKTVAAGDQSIKDHVTSENKLMKKEVFSRLDNVGSWQSNAEKVALCGVTGVVVGVIVWGIRGR